MTHPFQPSALSNPGVRMGAGPPTGQYYVSLMGQRGMSPDGWHWGVLAGRVPETVKIKGPLVPGQRVQFKRLHGNTATQWAVFRSSGAMPQHGGAGMPGPGMVGFDAYSMHPGVRVVVPPAAVPNPGDYGWAPNFPISKLTVSATASRRGLSNQPATATHQANLSLLSDFLGKLPFTLTITSGYRAPNVNAAIGGAKTSQHMNGLAVDASPQGVSNRDVAAWLFAHRREFPELDQVIWYTDTSHVHIGICPSAGLNCPRSSGPRAEFYRAKKEGSSYIPWAPTAQETAKMVALYAYHRPVKTVAVMWAVSVASSLSALGFLFWWRRRKRRMR
jgi:zinc D-Ala-D-Ala carboxypeptidase